MVQHLSLQIGVMLVKKLSEYKTLQIKISPLIEQSVRLIKNISEFPEVVNQAAKELAPHQIASYLKDCAAEFHSYYNDSKFLVEDEKIRVARLSLINSAKYVLKNGLGLLGIEAPQQM